MAGDTGQGFMTMAGAPGTDGIGPACLMGVAKAKILEAFSWRGVSGGIALG